VGPTGDSERGRQSRSRVGLGLPPAAPVREEPEAHQSGLQRRDHRRHKERVPGSRNVAPANILLAPGGHQNGILSKVRLNLATETLSSLGCELYFQSVDLLVRSYEVKKFKRIEGLPEFRSLESRSGLVGKK
jgi:hypothetical protein